MISIVENTPLTTIFFGHSHYCHVTTPANYYGETSSVI